MNDINRPVKYTILGTALKNFFGSPCEELTADEDNEVFDDIKSRRFKSKNKFANKSENTQVFRIPKIRINLSGNL